MSDFGSNVSLPLLLLIIALASYISIGFRRGIRNNRELAASAFNDLLAVTKPDDHLFTNIGGAVGFHANFFFKNKDPLSEIDATITMLPRQACFYMPISKLIMGTDRLFITFYMRTQPPGEGHLIEEKYASFRGPKITHIQGLHRESLRWGDRNFYLYYEMTKMYNLLTDFVKERSDPGDIRHIAVLPSERRGFIFMIPQSGKVAASFKPAYDLLIRIFTVTEKEG